MLSLPLVSPFPLGPSLGQGSLLCPGGCLSRLLRPGGRLSRLLRPGGRLSRLLRPGGRLSRLLRPGGRLSCLLRPGGRLSRLLRPGGRQSRLLRPGGRLSRLLCVKRLEAALRGGGGWLCHESGCHSLKLHITHGLHLPLCTALTHSRPPLHPSHSCHHSLISLDCLTSPAPHSLTHI